MPDNRSGDALFDWQDVLQSGRNRLGFGLRNFLRWSPGQYVESGIQTADPFAGQTEMAEHARQLLEKYGLSSKIAGFGPDRLLETLTYLDWLDTCQTHWPSAFAQAFSHPYGLSWLDAGAKNWAYVQAISAFMRFHYAGEFRLDGVELDPNRRYTNFQTRRQAALAFSRDIPEAAYHQGDLLEWHQRADVISHFLPFVLKDPHLAWGLPLTYFNPQALLNHLLDILNPGGLLIIVNQGEAEAEAQQSLLQIASERCSLEWKSLGQMPARFIEYRYPRYGWLCMKGGNNNHERNRANADYYPGLQK